MSDYMAQMLNELMGPQRNAMPGENAELDFDHPDVCRDFLVGFCLNDCFRNTKNDIGYCAYAIHDESMRKRYKESKRCGRLGYEEKFNERCRRMHLEVRRKIDKNEARLHVTQGEHHVSVDPIERKRNELKERREMIGRKIEALMDEAQVEGERGNVAAAQAAVEKADELTRERASLDTEEERLDDEAKRAIALEDQVTAGNKQMQVCQVCGCFMLTNDAQSRIDDHLSGKLHLAYLKIKEYLEELDKERDTRRKPVDVPRERSREKEDITVADKSEGRDRKDRDRRGDRDRDRRDRSRDRGGDRDRETKDRDRGARRSRSRDRGVERRGDRDRDGRGGSGRSDRDRRDRSRSRDRRRR